MSPTPERVRDWFVVPLTAPGAGDDEPARRPQESTGAPSGRVRAASPPGGTAAPGRAPLPLPAAVPAGAPAPLALVSAPEGAPVAAPELIAEIPPRRSRRPRPVERPSRVCVLGADAPGAAFGLVLAQRLARTAVPRNCVACLWDGRADERPGRRGAVPAPAARRLGALLAGGGHRVVVHGRVVRTLLPADAAAAAVSVESIGRQVGPVGVVAILTGPRDVAFDALLATQDLVLVVVGADAAPALAELALASLATVAPRALLRAVPLPDRLAGPARRAAVRNALGALA